MKKLIGIAGKKSAGKDTIARMIKFIQYNDKSEFKPEVLSLIDLLYENSDLTDKYKVKKFADSLKLFVSNLLCDQDFIYKWENNICNFRDSLIDDTKCDNLKKFLNRSHITNRELLQFIGTDICRNLIDSNIWINMSFAE